MNFIIHSSYCQLVLYKLLILLMASFYICHNQNPQFLPQPQPYSQIDAALACKILRKASLKLTEVTAKLDVSKVIRFLESLQSQSQNKHLDAPQNNGQIKNKENVGLITFKQMDNLGSRTPSIMQISTSKSFMSFQQDKQIQQNESIYKKLITSQFDKEKSLSPAQSNKENYGSLEQSFKLRQVVTKNGLEQCEGSKKVKFKDSSNHQITVNIDKEKLSLLQKIAGQQSKLKAQVTNIFKYFSAKGLVQSPNTWLNLELKEVQSMSKQLFSSFDKREVEWEFQRKKLNQVKSEYLLTLKNLSSDLKEKAVNTNQTSIVHQHPPQLQNIETKEKEMSTANSKIQELKGQIAQISQKLKQKAQEIQKYEMMLFIKDEQISSLRILNSNLENRINKLTKGDDRPRSRSYKKFFEQLDQNMSATVS